MLYYNKKEDEMKKIYNKFNNACKEVKAIQKGKLPIITLRDIIDELEKKSMPYPDKKRR